MANEQPHSHQPRLRRRYGDHGGFYVEYGDQEIYIRRRTHSDKIWIEHRPKYPTKKQVQKALAKAIRYHDHGSVAHHQYDEVLNHGAEVDQWASEVKK